MRHCLLACALLFAAAFAPGRAAAAECIELGAPPIQMTAGGRYCLGANVSINSTSGNPIRIDGNNIELDCRGFSIVNANTDPAGTTNAIYVSGRRNIRIRNCHISGGFAAGIYAYQDNGLANQARDVTIDGNSVSGAFWYGILAYGTGITIRDNEVQDIGGRDSFAMGIRVGASTLAGESRQAIVTGNRIARVSSPVNNAYGIYGNSPQRSVFTDNTILDTAAPTANYIGYGIYLGGAAQDSRVSGNTIIGNTVGVTVGVFSANYNECFHNYTRADTNYIYCDVDNGNY